MIISPISLVGLFCKCFVVVFSAFNIVFQIKSTIGEEPLLILAEWNSSRAIFAGERDT